MSHNSKSNTRSDRHEKHIARNGQNATMKKAGAGRANWGIEGDETLDFYEYAHQEIEKTIKPAKMKVVDSETFKSMQS
ncbi:hypothetical protein BD408DRAFT_439586 [Parasitella parasitica]|nr:hypothetical protein BD408DRAFT_439586 [Parasitella parasitica]